MSTNTGATGGNSILLDDNCGNNTCRWVAVAVVVVACFVPALINSSNSSYHVDDHVRDWNSSSYKTAVSVVVAMCCPVVVDLLDRYGAGVEQRILGFKFLLVFFGLLIPNMLIMLFCFKPLNQTLLNGIILAQVSVLEWLLLVVLNRHDPVIWTDFRVNAILFLRLSAVICVLVRMFASMSVFIPIFYGLLALSFICWLCNMFFWLRAHFAAVVHVVTHRQLQLFELDEQQLANLYNSVVMVILECAYVVFFSMAAAREANFNVMLYAQAFVICLVTLFPGQLARRRAVQAQSALETKKSLVQYISHEARGPLQVANIGLEMQLRDIDDVDGVWPADPQAWLADRREQTVEVMHACALAQEALNDMLTFDKLENGMLVIEREQLALIPFLQSQFNAFKIQARFKNLRMTFDWESDVGIEYADVSVMADKHKIAQAVRNFLSNAIKFTPRGGEISMKLKFLELDISGDKGSIPRSYSPHNSLNELAPEQSLLFDEDESSWSRTFSEEFKINENMFEGSSNGREYRYPTRCYVRLEVHDSGPGLAQVDVNRLFGKYVQIDASKMQGGGGTGLGLYITKNILAMHGGFVSASSPGLGKGCVFSMDLPVHSFIADLPDMEAPEPSAEPPQAGNDDAPGAVSHVLQRIIGRPDSIVHSAVPEIITATSPSTFELDISDIKVSGKRGAVGSNSQKGYDSLPLEPTVGGAAAGVVVAGADTSTPDTDANANANDETYLERIRAVSVLDKYQEMQSVQQDTVAKVILSPVSEETAAPSETNLTVLSNLRVLRVLVVDDSLPNRKIVCKSLRRVKECRVICHEAENGEEAVAIMRKSLRINPGNKFNPRVNYDDPEQCYFDLILMDSHMPVMNGSEAIVQIRKELGHRCLIFGVTGAEEDQVGMIEAGADRTFVKPIRLNTITSIVQGCMCDLYVDQV